MTSTGRVMRRTGWPNSEAAMCGAWMYPALCGGLRAGRRIPHARHWPRLEALEDQRARGASTAHSPQANQRRGQKNAAHYRANAAFAGSDDIDYQRDIAPHLERFSAREIARATGLSVSYASFIRAGKRIPHARHWPRFAALVDGA